MLLPPKGCSSIWMRSLDERSASVLKAWSKEGYGVLRVPSSEVSNSSRLSVALAAVVGSPWKGSAMKAG